MSKARKLYKRHLSVYIEDSTQRRLRQFPEVNWSEIIRQFLKDYLDALEKGKKKGFWWRHR